MDRRNNGEFKIPGEKLAVVEEFMPGPGTFIESGDIRSKATGYLIADAENKLISVYPKKRRPVYPRKGSTVVGYVVSTQDKTASIRILSVDNQPVPGEFTGIVHVSTVSPSYIRTMHEAIRAGDLVRAKVISNKNRAIHLSTLGRDLGVIQASCSRCGNSLSKRGRVLRCSICSKVEERKTAADYQKEGRS